MSKLIEQQEKLVTELQGQLTAEAERGAPNIATYSEALSRAVEDLVALDKMKPPRSGKARAG